MKKCKPKMKTAIVSRQREKKYLKIISRLLVLVMLLTSALTFSGCGEIFPILDTDVPDLDQSPIYYLCIGDISKCDYVDNIEYGYYDFEGNYSIVNGESRCSTPILNISYGFDSENIEKRSHPFYLIKSNGINIWGVFYPFNDKIEDITFEFGHTYSSHHIFNKVVYVYNKETLIGKVYYKAHSSASKEWMKSFLNDNLILMSIYNYSDINEIEIPTLSGDVLSKGEHILSYLTVGNLNGSELCGEVVEFSSRLEGGMDIEYGTKNDENVTNTVNLKIRADESLGFAEISVDARFFGYKSDIGTLDYVIENSNGAQTVYVYSGDDLLGEISISSDVTFSNDYIEQFAYDILVVIEIEG